MPEETPLHNAPNNPLKFQKYFGKKYDLASLFFQGQKNEDIKNNYPLNRIYLDKR